MRILASLACVFAFFFCLTLGVEAQRFFRQSKPCPPSGCQIATGPLSAYQVVEVPAPEPSLPTWAGGDTASPPPNIVLDPLPGTGLKSPTTLLQPKVSHSLDPATMAELKELFKQKLGPQQASIHLPMADATSERLSRILMLLEALAWLGGGMLGVSGLGKFGPLAARLVSGLQAVLPAPSPPPPPTTSATSSPSVTP